MAPRFATRNRNVRQRQFVQAASEAAESVREILSHYYGAEPWVDQVAEAVKNAVQNGYEQLRPGGGVQGNNMPGEQYRFDARTREELLASQHEVADSRHVPPTEEELDPAEQQPDDQPTQQRNSTGPVQWVL